MTTPTAAATTSQEAKRTGDLARIKAMILVDMIGDRDLVIKRETASTAWLTDAIWSAAKALGHGSTFVAESFAVEDDHVPFLNAGVPAVDIIDLEYAPWHTAEDTLDKVSARSMEVVGRVLTAALPKIESRLLGPPAADRPPARCRAASQATRMPAAPTVPPDAVAVRAARLTPGSMTPRMVDRGPLSLLMQRLEREVVAPRPDHACVEDHVPDNDRRTPPTRAAPRGAGRGPRDQARP